MQYFIIHSRKEKEHKMLFLFWRFKFISLFSLIGFHRVTESSAIYLHCFSYLYELNKYWNILHFYLHLIPNLIQCSRPIYFILIIFFKFTFNICTLPWVVWKSQKKLSEFIMYNVLAFSTSVLWCFAFSIEIKVIICLLLLYQVNNVL